MDNKEKNLNFNFNLSSSERLELEIIALDKDGDSAFNFTRKHNISINEADSLKYCIEWLKKIKKGEEEKLKIEIEPSDIREAMARIIIIERLLKAKPRVLGKDRIMTSQICLKLILKENRGRKW